MIARYVAAGVAVLAVSAAVLIYGAAAFQPQLVGLGASMAMVGIVMASVGSATGEATASWMKEFSALLGDLATRFIEDADLLGARLVAIKGSDGAGYIVVARGPVGGAVRAGLGANGSQYIALRARVGAIEDVVAADKEEVFKEALCSGLALCSSARLEESQGVVKLTLRDPPRDAVEMLGLPLNPIAVFSLLAALKAYGRPMRLISATAVGGRAEIVMAGEEA